MINNMTPTVKQLLIINIIFFLGSMVVPGAEKMLSLYYFENPNFKIWQPLTSMFMHGSIMHIAFNMLALISFGNFNGSAPVCQIIPQFIGYFPFQSNFNYKM